MIEYYKLSILREDKKRADWEYFYLKIDGDQSKIILYIPSQIMGTLSNSKLEEITKEEMDKAISNIDYCPI